MKRILALGLSATTLAFASTAQAWTITPVWEHLVSTNPAAMTIALPILTNTWNGGASGTKTFNRQDGTDRYPVLGALHRYDANRLLLAITENGIDENWVNTTYDPALEVLTNNFPDRSLIWINPTNGQSMGVALKVGFQPVELDQWYTNTCAAQTLSDNINGTAIPMTSYYAQQYFGFGVSDDGFIYTGYKNKMIRYRPDGSGGFLPTPEEVFSCGTSTNSLGQTNGFANNPPNNAELYRWFSTDGMFASIHVRGAGVNTVITAGGMGESGNNHHSWILTTQDGTNFYGICRLQGDSFITAAINAPTNFSALPGELWVFRGNFPVNNAGNGNSVNSRYGTPPTYTNTWPNRTTGWSYPARNINSNTPAQFYRQTMIGGGEARDGVPFVAFCQVPSWNSKVRNVNDGDPYWFKDGAIGLNDVISGARVGWWDQTIKESDVTLPLDSTANWLSTYANLSLSIGAGADRPDGSYEILWGSYVYGYGRYIVKPDAITITNLANAGATSTVYFTANTSTNNAYVLQRGANVTSPGWQDIGAAAPWPGPYVGPGTAFTDPSAPDSNAFYRVRLVVP
jgi:hypothetical protein